MKGGKIEPLGDYVVLRLASPVGKTPGGLLLPEQYQKKPQKGEVLAVGPDCKDTTDARDAARGFVENAKAGESMKAVKRLKPGMVVVFNTYAGCAHPDDETILLLREDELLGVIQ